MARRRAALRKTRNVARFKIDGFYQESGAERDSKAEHNAGRDAHDPLFNQESRLVIASYKSVVERIELRAESDATGEREVDSAADSVGKRGVGGGRERPVADDVSVAQEKVSERCDSFYGEGNLGAKKEGVRRGAAGQPGIGETWIITRKISDKPKPFLCLDLGGSVPAIESTKLGVFITDPGEIAIDIRVAAKDRKTVYGLRRGETAEQQDRENGEREARHLLPPSVRSCGIFLVGCGDIHPGCSLTTPSLLRTGSLQLWS